MVANSTSTRPVVRAGIRFATASGTNSTETPSSFANKPEMSASNPSCLPPVSTKPQGGLSPWIPTTSFPLAFISAGMTALARRAGSMEAAASAAAVNRMRRRSVLWFMSFPLPWKFLSTGIAASSRGDRKPALQPCAVERQWPADREIKAADDAEDEQGLEDLIGDDAAGACEFGEADDRRQRGSLEELHEETDRGWQRDAQRLRQNHVLHPRHIM